MKIDIFLEKIGFQLLNITYRKIETDFILKVTIVNVSFRIRKAKPDPLDNTMTVYYRSYKRDGIQRWDISYDKEYWSIVQ